MTQLSTLSVPNPYLYICRVSAMTAVSAYRRRPCESEAAAGRIRIQHSLVPQPKQGHETELGSYTMTMGAAASWRPQPLMVPAMVHCRLSSTM